MANEKISQLATFTGDIADDDFFEIVDFSDKTMAPTGTNKRIPGATMPYVKKFQSNIIIVGEFTVTKVSPNTANSIQVGDKVYGWIDNVFVAGQVKSIPVTSKANLSIAVSGTFIPDAGPEPEAPPVLTTTLS